MDNSWLGISQALGIPSAILLIICYGTSKIIPWVGQNVVLPFVNKHLAFVDAVQKTLTEDVGPSMRMLAESHAKLSRAQTSLAEQQTNLAEQQTVLSKVQTDVAKLIRPSESKM